MPIPNVQALPPTPGRRRLRSAGLSPGAARARILQLLAETPPDPVPAPWPERLPDWAPALASHPWEYE